MLASAAVAYGVWAAYQVDERYLWVGMVVGAAIGAMTSPFWWPTEPDAVIERVPEVAR
jgi:hypothetical protein